MIYCEGEYCSRKDQCAYHELFESKHLRQYIDESTEGHGYGGIDSNGKPFFHHEFYCGDRAKYYRHYKALGWREGEKYVNSEGFRYDEVCVNCEHRGLCFKLLEQAGMITASGERISFDCEEIKAEPERYKEFLRQNGWKEIE
jgi:hypothetical protein